MSKKDVLERELERIRKEMERRSHLTVDERLKLLERDLLLTMTTIEIILDNLEARQKFN